MNLTLAHIGSRAKANDGFEALAQLYLSRSAAFARCQAECFRSEEAFFAWLDRQQGRVQIVLLDSRGRQMSSEDFAVWLGKQRDEGAQHIVIAVGPASGWTRFEGAAGGRAGLQLSLGPMTMAHSLARVVAAEQIYRAFTILSGHPYHTGH